MMKRNTCDSCYFWDGDTGRCHRHAPRPSTPNELVAQVPEDDIEAVTIGGIWNQDLTAWPKTDSGDWCGEWRQYTEDA